MTQRREVRVHPAFFDDLDEQLGPTRGPNGEPSSTDFLRLDLPSILDRFAEGFESLPPALPGRLDYRAVVASGTLIARAVVFGRIVDGNTVELVGVELDLDWPGV